MQLSDLHWPSVARLSRDVPIVLPVAALEQHSLHLPLLTDSMLLGEIIRRVSLELDDRAVFAPVLWIGNSHHHLDFPGTMSAEPRTYLDLLLSMMENFLMQGFRRIVLVSGHGGNVVPSQQAVFELRQKYRSRNDLLLLSCAYWTLGGRPQDEAPDIRQPRMRHACEWETSMMLRIAPRLVGDYQSLEEVPITSAFEPAFRGWTMPDYSAVGHVGDPRHATADKGEVMLRVFAEDVVRLIEKVIAWQPPAEGETPHNGDCFSSPFPLGFETEGGKRGAECSSVVQTASD